MNDGQILFPEIHVFEEADEILPLSGHVFAFGSISELSPWPSKGVNLQVIFMVSIYFFFKF